jgi:hypothetical protein
MDLANSGSDFLRVLRLRIVGWEGFISKVKSLGSSADPASAGSWPEA